MKKKLACLLTALLVFSCATPVLAAPSSEATQPKVEVEADVEGLEVVQEVAEEVKEEAEKEAEKAAAEVSDDTTASVVAVVEINFEGEVPEGGIKLTLKVDGVKAGENVVLLHKKADGTWETIKPVEVRDGAIVAVFTSFSPVAIVKLAAETAGDATPEDTTPEDGKSDKTGVPFVLPVAALVCAAGATVCGRKVKSN